MNQTFEKTAEQATGFQKMWSETAARMFQAALSATPNSPPPEFLRQIRSGIFQALAKSWDEFMRSPEFLENMRQWMENAISFRKVTNDFMARVRNEVQAPSRDDIDAVMINVRHMEKRILDRLDDMAREIASLKEQRAAVPPSKSPRKGKAARPKEATSRQDGRQRREH